MPKPTRFIAASALWLTFLPSLLHAQEETLPSADTLMREVWEQEERIGSIRGTFTQRNSTATRDSGSSFALEPGKRFWYLVDDSGANGYTIAATRERVTRKFPQIIEDFPVSIWEMKPIPLAVDIFSDKMQIERVLQPLHGHLGFWWKEEEFTEFATQSVTKVGDNLVVSTTDDEETFSVSYTISRVPVAHLVQIDVTGLLGGMTHRFDGEFAGKPSNLWVTTRLDFASGNYQEVLTLTVDWDSVNQDLPEELFVVDDSGMEKVDYNRFLPRLEHMIDDGMLEDRGYAYMGFRELFPKTFMAIIAIAVVLVIGVLALLVILVRRMLSAVTPDEGTQ